MNGRSDLQFVTESLELGALTAAVASGVDDTSELEAEVVVAAEVDAATSPSVELATTASSVAAACASTAPGAETVGAATVPDSVLPADVASVAGVVPCPTAAEPETAARKLAITPARATVRNSAPPVP